MALADTSFLIDFGNGNGKAIEVAARVAASGKMAVSTVSVFELSSGSPPGLEEKNRRLLQAMKIIEFNYLHAEQAGVIFRRLKQRGEEIGAQDAMIAATAIVEREPLITKNAKHFKRIEGLEVITY